MFCPRCQTEKPNDAFYKSALARRKKGVWCKSCQTDYYRKRVSSDREYFLKYQNKTRNSVRARVSAIKAERGCADCGERTPCCLTFHHNEPALKVSEVRELVDRRAAAGVIEAEIAKTTVLCRNCHRVRHWTEQQNVDRSGFKKDGYYAKYGRSLQGRRKEYMEGVLVERGCKWCGECHPGCLEFHHRDPSQKDTEVTKLALQKANWDRILAEIAKCDVTCANCHAKHHWKKAA